MKELENNDQNSKKYFQLSQKFTIFAKYFLPLSHIFKKSIDPKIYAG